jgi:hypothetical protein
MVSIADVDDAEAAAVESADAEAGDENDMAVKEALPGEAAAKVAEAAAKPSPREFSFSVPRVDLSAASVCCIMWIGEGDGLPFSSNLASRRRFTLPTMVCDWGGGGRVGMMCACVRGGVCGRCGECG